MTSGARPPGGAAGDTGQDPAGQGCPPGLCSCGQCSRSWCSCSGSTSSTSSRPRPLFWELLCRRTTAKSLKRHAVRLDWGPRGRVDTHGNHKHLLSTYCVPDAVQVLEGQGRPSPGPWPLSRGVQPCVRAGRGLRSPPAVTGPPPGAGAAARQGTGLGLLGSV